MVRTIQVIGRRLRFIHELKQSYSDLAAKNALWSRYLGGDLVRMKLRKFAAEANSTIRDRNHSSRYRKQILTMRTVSGRIPLLRRALSAAALSLCMSAVNAQTAHYSGTQITLVNSIAPAGVAVDSGGNIYFSDPANNRVLELPRTSSGYGTQTTVGANLSLSKPEGVAVDLSGNVYIADTGNGRVVKIPPNDLNCATSSNCTSVGTGLTSPVAVATDGSGNVFIADSSLTRVMKVPAADLTCTTPGDCTNVGANLLQPHGVAVDASGNVYIADTGNGRVLRVPPTDPTCTTSGDCTSVGTGLASPESVAVDGRGNVYIADSSLTSLLRVLGTDLTCATPGDCTTVGTGLSSPSGVALDRNGNVEISNSGGSSLLQVQLTAVDFGGANIGTASATVTVPFVFDSGGSLNSTTPYQVRTLGAPGLDFARVGGTCSGTGTYTQGDSCTLDIAFTPKFAGARYGAVLLEDASGNVIATAYVHGIGVGPQVALTPGTISTVAGNGTQGFSNNVLATSAQFNTPLGVAVDGAGNLYIANIYDSIVQVVLKSTGIVSTVAGGGGAPGQDNGYSGDGGPGTSAQLYYPSSVAVDGAGNIFIADSSNNVIRKLAAVSGIITTVAGNGTAGYSGDGGPATSATLNNPYGVAVDGAGNLYIADKNNNVVRKVSTSTGLISTIAGNGTGGFSGDGGPATSAQLGTVYSVALDSVGNLFIADYSNDRIRKVEVSTGIISTVAGNGTFGYNGDGGAATSAELNSVEGVAVDGAGNIYIADLFNNRVRMVSAGTGLISTIAGNGTKGYSGDGGPATSAELSNPSGVFVDGDGNIYIGDAGNFVVREVNVKAASINFLTATGVGTTDTTDGPQTITVNNIGSSPLTFPVPATGTNPTISSAAGFTEDSSETCPNLSATSSAATLASGSNCTYVVDFAPVVVGTNSGSLVLSNNDLNISNSTQSIALSGNGVNVVLITPTLSVTNSPLPYNGSAQAAVVTGSVPGTVSNVKYSGSSTVPTLAGTYAITADFTPTDTTTYASLTGASAGNFVISKVVPTVSVTNSPLPYSGSAQAAVVTGSVPGTVSNVKYSGSSTVPTLAGTYAITADFTPTDATDYASLTGASAGNFVIGKVAPTLTVTNSPLPYSGSAQAAVVTASVPGTVSNVKYSGSATVPSSAGTYAITADFTPTDTTTYASLTGASAGNFVISKVVPTVSVTNSPLTYSGSAQAAVVTGSVPGTVINVKYSGSATVPSSAGTYAVTADFTPTDATDYASLTGVTAGNLVISKATPTMTVNPSAASIGEGTPLNVTVQVTGSGATPTGTLTLSGGGYTSSVATLAGGTYTFTIPANSLSIGTDALTVSYSGESNYAGATGTTSVTVTKSVYTMSATAASVSPGGTATSSVTIASTNGYAGTIKLTCAVTQGPAGASDSPTCTSSQTVTLNASSTSGTASVMISTTAPTTGALERPNLPGRNGWSGAGGGAVLALVVLLGIPAKRRRWQSMLGLLIATVFLGGLAACGGAGSFGGGTTNPANPGTTPGTYTITVTGTGNDSATTTETTTLVLTVK
jgi:trimeric autotransporter adhesin